MTKRGMITIPVNQNNRWERAWLSPSLMIMIKLSELAEDHLLFQIKRMSSYYTIADLLMSSQENYQRYRRNQKINKFFFTDWDIPNYTLPNRRKLTSTHVEQCCFWRKIFSRRNKKWDLNFLDKKETFIWRIFEKVILILIKETWKEMDFEELIWR